MKITIVNTSERKGGAAIAANRLMKALRHTGVDAKMLISGNSSDDPNVISVQQSVISQLIVRFCFIWERLVIFIHNKFNRTNLFKVSIANIGIDITSHPHIQSSDVIHIHWINQGFLSLSNIKKLVSTGKPIVWTLHDMWPATGICHYPDTCKKYSICCSNCPLLFGEKEIDLSQKTFNKKKSALMDQIYYVGCSQWISNQVKNSAIIKKAAICSIPNPIDTQIFYPKNVSEVRRRLQLPEDKLLILFSAAKLSDMRKGVTYFIEACQYIKRQFPVQGENIEIVLMGSSDDELISQMPLITHSLNYISNDSEMADVYSGVDLFVIPSLEDNLPNTIMEAMACGTPCVGFDTGGVPEMIDHLQNGYVAEYKNATDLSKGILHVLDQSHLKPYGLQARQKVESQYQQSVVAKQYIELYTKLINESSHENYKAIK